MFGRNIQVPGGGPKPITCLFGSTTSHQEPYLYQFAASTSMDEIEAALRNQKDIITRTGGEVCLCSLYAALFVPYGTVAHPVCFAWICVAQ